MEDALVKRIPPHDDEAEKSVIGSMLMNRDAVIAAAEMLEPEDFYERQLGVIFDTMKEMYDADLPIDPVTLLDRLKEKNLPPEVAGPEYLRGLIDAVPTSANVKYYADIVKQKAVLRRLIRAAQDIENESFQESRSTEDILDDAEKKIFDVLKQKKVADFVPIHDIVAEALGKIESASRSHSHITGLDTGFTDLNNQTSGFQPSDLILIAARPSMGKTALALNIAANMAIGQGIPTLLFSLEMSRDQLVNRLIAQESHVDSQKIRTGQMNDDEWEKIVEAAGRVGGSKLIIDDTPGISISELRSKARRYTLDHGVKIIFIDYLQLMAGNSKADNRQQEVSEISRALKSLARELNVPVVALSQLNRSVEQRDDHRPMLSDLRESGAIEQDADVVMFIYRDDYYHKDSEEQGVAEIIVAKQRNGPVGTIKLVWLAKYTQFKGKETEKDTGKR